MAENKLAPKVSALVDGGLYNGRYRDFSTACACQ